MFTLLLIIAVAVAAFTAGVVADRRLALRYRRRWQEALHGWMKERDGTAALDEITMAVANKAKGSKADYHDLPDKARFLIAQERFEKGLPIQDDLKGLGNEEEYRVGEGWKTHKQEIIRLRNKQLRKAELKK